MVIKNLQMQNSSNTVEIDHLPSWFNSVETLEYVYATWHEGWEVFAVQDPTDAKLFLILFNSPWFEILASHGYIENPCTVGDHLCEFLDQGEFVKSADGSYIRKVIRNGIVHIDRFSADNGLESGGEKDFVDLPDLFAQQQGSGVSIIPGSSGVSIVDEPEPFEFRFIKKESIGKPTPFDTDPADDPEAYIWGTMRSICRHFSRKGLISEEEFHNLLAF